MNRTEILEHVKASIGEVVTPIPDLTTITEDSTFDSLGMDSLDLIEVIFEVEDEVDVNVPTTAIDSITTVGELVTVLYDLIAANNEPYP